MYGRRETRRASTVSYVPLSAPPNVPLGPEGKQYLSSQSKLWRGAYVRFASFSYRNIPQFETYCTARRAFPSLSSRVVSCRFVCTAVRASERATRSGGKVTSVNVVALLSRARKMPSYGLYEHPRLSGVEARSTLSTDSYS